MFPLSERRHLIKNSLSLHRRVGAFTLIELLVGIAICAVLAILLLSMTDATKNRAALATCASNMRQLGIGLDGFVQDNNGFYPPTWFPWTYALTEGGYISDPKVFLCPGDTINKAGPDPNTGKSMGRSYSYCSSVMTADTGIPTHPLNKNLIDRLSKQYILTEWHGEDFTLGGDGKPIQGIIRGITPFNPVSPSHKDGCNFLFADGHVEYRSNEVSNDPYSGWLLNQIK